MVNEKRKVSGGIREELRPMLRLAWPIVLAEIGWMAMGIEDTFMVGHLPQSAVAIGATSLGSGVFHAIAICGSAVLLGLDTFVSQAHGAREEQEARRWLLNGVWLALILTPLMMAVIALAVPGLKWFGVNPEVFEATVPFIRALNWSVLPLALYFTFRRFLQATDVVRPVTWVLLSANGVNIAANYAFIYGHWGAPAMGLRGSALSTVMARVYMAGGLLTVISWREAKLKWQHFPAARRKIFPQAAMMWRLFKMGAPAAGQIGVEITVFALMTAFIAKLDATQLASSQIALNCCSLTYMVPLGMSSAAAVRVGQALGRKRKDQAAAAGWTAILLSAAFMLMAAVVFLAVPRPLARLFTMDAAVISRSVPLFAVAAAFQLFDALQAVSTGALRGSGETRIPIVVNILAYWLICLPLGYWLCFVRGWGATGMWVGISSGLMIIGSVLVGAWGWKTRGWSSAGGF